MTASDPGRLHRAYLSIGSNIGDKRENLEHAIAMLDGHAHIRIEAVSGFYATEPQNFKDQDWFVNAALKIRTTVRKAWVYRLTACSGV